MRYDDENVAWCPYCKEHHKDESYEAAVKFIEQICAEEEQ